MQNIEDGCKNIEDGCKNIGPLPSFNKLLRKALVQLGILLCTIWVLGFKRGSYFVQLGC